MNGYVLRTEGCIRCVKTALAWRLAAPPSDVLFAVAATREVVVRGSRVLATLSEPTLRGS